METKIVCKKCRSSKIVKNGFVRERQRYKCKQCKYNFVFGDKRIKISKTKLALIMLFYGHGRASMRFLAKVCKVSPQCIMTWIRNESRKLEEPGISDNIKDIELDEMWHFYDSKKNRFGFGKPLIAREIKLSHGWSVLATLHRAKSYTTK